MVKLQNITGDRYIQCDPSLAPYCCMACEDDNPAIENRLCRQCYSQGKPLITKTEARELYKIKDFSSIPCDVRKFYILYSREDLEKHMLAVHGSKIEWLKAIAEREERRKKRNENANKRLEETNAFIQTLSQDFQEYIRFYNVGKKSIEAVYSRYIALRDGLLTKNLNIRLDSRLCQMFIIHEIGIVDEIVETMEEMTFLYNNTDYSRRSSSNIAIFREMQSEYLPREEYNRCIQACYEDAKEEICIEYLQKVGYILPSKWEACRPRFNQVIANGIDPTDYDASSYIYHNIRNHLCI